MRPRPLLACLCCLTLLAACGGGGATHTVTVGPGGAMIFDPATVTIRPGDTVQWVWASDGHTVTSGDSTTCATSDGRFCSPADATCNAGTLGNTGATYSHTFAAAGTYTYFCWPHCSAGMKGSVVVAP